MYVRRHVRWSLIWKFAWRDVLFFTLWSLGVTASYKYLRARDIDISIPFLPLSTIGVAVAFYLGFKNNQSYDRFWEARKIWGGIVNASRTWANQVLTHFPAGAAADAPVQGVARRLIYRQLGWINVLRVQLRHTTIRDRKNLSYVPDLKLQREHDKRSALVPFVSPEECSQALAYVNSAVHLLRKQAADLQASCLAHGVTDYRMVSMLDTLGQLYTLQGQCERIKNTPFPRQYAYFSAVFTWIFVVLLPFGMVGEFGEHDHRMIFLTVPFCVLISWIFVTMEVVGDNSEDPFENHITDVPMTALCRSIEIDLRQMLGETDIPPKLEPVNDILL